MSNELRPCPACKNSEDNVHDYLRDREYFIQCGYCSMQGPVCRNEKMAFRAWNALPRHEDSAELVEALEACLTLLKGLKAQGQHGIFWEIDVSSAALENWGRKKEQNNDPS